MLFSLLFSTTYVYMSTTHHLAMIVSWYLTSLQIIGDQWIYVNDSVIKIELSLTFHDTTI
jgi:hypothetical protein